MMPSSLFSPRAWALPLAIALASCGGGSAPASPASASSSAGAPSPSAAPSASAAPSIARRPVEPHVDGELVRAGIAYGPHREGQAPTGAQPSEAQILEDLEILAARWQMLRVYGATGVTETILRLIREHELPLRVMLGAWVDRERPPGDDDAEPLPDRARNNDVEVDAAIRLANAYPDVVFAVCVGNETQVFWSGHRTRRARLIELIRRAREAVAQPVTTADDYNFWNRPEAAAVAAEIDFLVLHAYAMWNRQELEDAVPWTAQQVEATRAAYPNLPVYLGETGWATRVHPSGDAARQIVGEAGEAEQAMFYRRFTAWAREADLPYFFFEAFDEPWKGGPHPDEVEKHWGLFHVDRTPKDAMRDGP